MWLVETFGVDEVGFLLAALENPSDPGPLLIAADWLEEHGSDPTLAEYIRRSVALATGGPGTGRANELSRLNQIERQAIGDVPDARHDIFPTATDQPQGKRKYGDLYRVVGSQLQRRGGKGSWTPHAGDIPCGVARRLLGQLARQYARPNHERISDFYGERIGRDRVIRGQLEEANTHAYQLHASARSGFHGSVRELRMSRVQWFHQWLADASDLVTFLEIIAGTGHQAPGQDARSMAYFGTSLDRLARGDADGLHDEQLMARASDLWARYETAMRRMSAPRVLPANAGEPW